MKAALAALAPTLSAAAAMAPGLRAIDPEQQSARDYFKPGGQFEKDDPGIRQRLHDDEINRRAQEEMRGVERGRLSSQKAAALRGIPIIPIADRRPSQQCGTICFGERRGRACLA